jgi:hypothetical protein
MEQNKILDYIIEDIVMLKASHNASIISCIMYSMYAKIWCGTSINDERDEISIII